MTKLEAHYDTCTVNTTVPEYGLTMMVNHQAEFFPNQEAPLHTCEYDGEITVNVKHRNIAW